MHIKIIAIYTILISIIVSTNLLLLKPNDDDKEDVDFDTPTPALGRMIATSIHQVVTDPYLVPLEKLSHYLSEHPDLTEIRVDLITKWAPDNNMPISFVHDMIMGTTQIDHPASPWALEEVVNRVSNNLRQNKRNNLISISTFVVGDEKYWLGFIRVPYRSDKPQQIAGVFFSMDSYLNDYVPRWISDMVNRSRFPLVEFQQNNSYDRDKVDGHISFKILMSDSTEYFQQGRTFDANQLIYAESANFPNPIVCMQRGWDLQVFSSGVIEESEHNYMQLDQLLLIFIEVILVAGLFWWNAVSTRNSKGIDND